MKYILQSLFCINLCISIGCIINNGFWINYNDMYIKTSQFGFYLCVTCISILFNILLIILKYNYHKSEQILNNLICLFSFLLVILWTAASITITLLVTFVQIHEFSQTFIHIIANSVLGFINVCIWFVIFCITIVQFINVYKKEPALEAQASDEISRHNSKNVRL